MLFGQIAAHRAKRIGTEVPPTKKHTCARSLRRITPPPARAKRGRGGYAMVAVPQTGKGRL
ncbi:DUF6053 domain-containing protein [Lysobacter enzymogenes]|uniref:DUF6053 domain-containing protein n=1 Tax=Lysobacter enzymogenes TaxID=69 RepID=UPI003D18E8F6